MKKTLYSLCALVALSLMGMTSCTKANDEKTDDDPKPVTATVEFLAAKLDGQENYVDQSFALVVDGQNVNLTFSAMEEVTDETLYPVFFDAIKDNLILQDLPSASFKVYKYSAGTFTEGKTVSCGDVTYTARADRPDKEQINILDAYSLIATGGSDYHNQVNANTSKGVYNSALEAFCALKTLSMGFSYTVK